MLHQKILDSVVPIFAFFDSPSSSETEECAENSISLEMISLILLLNSLALPT